MMPIADRGVLAAAFQQGDVKLKGQFMLGSNHTFLAEVGYRDAQIPAVYKPQRGEQPLWDFPDNSLAQREVAAFLVSEALGWALVPFTTLRKSGPLGPGSLQEYIDYDPEYHYFTFSDSDKARLRSVAVFDMLTNNADRKGSHVLFQNGTGHLYAIDHGLCFHEEDKLRTVIWDFAGEVIPAELVAALAKLKADLSGPGLCAELEPYLTPGEMRVLSSRAEKLIMRPEFPNPPGHRRAFPYPPI